MNFENHTSYAAGWTLGFEPDGRELLVVVVKATFDFPKNGGLPLPADDQVPLVEADEFTGEPGYSAVLFESDYAHRKPACDVLLNGSAYAPDGRPVEKLTVSMRVGDMAKAFNVIGDRVWDHIMMRDTPTLPLKFIKKSITYDNAFGGSDTDPGDTDKVKTYVLNPVGRGYYPLSTGKYLQGKPLPNTQETGKPIKDARSGTFRPMAFGAMGRNFKQRLKYAGTYDQNWLDTQAPFWPVDFDYQYFQAAPIDQRIPYPKGGEPVILKNLTPGGITSLALPKLEIPVLLAPYRETVRQMIPEIDTILLEPDLGRFCLTGRIALPLKRNCFELKDVIVGETIKNRQRRQRAGSKPYFKGLAQFVDFKRAAGT